MSDDQPMSAPTPEPHGPRDGRAVPSSIRKSVALVWAIVALSVLNALLTLVLLDDLVAGALESQAGGLTEQSARTSAIFGAVFGLVFAALWVMLAVLLRRGVNWARLVLTVLAAIGVVFGLFGLTLGSTPPVFLAVGVVTLVLEAALLYFLWQRDSSAYLKPRPTY